MSLVSGSYGFLTSCIHSFIVLPRTLVIKKGIAIINIKISMYTIMNIVLLPAPDVVEFSKSVIFLISFQMIIKIIIRGAYEYFK